MATLTSLSNSEPIGTKDPGLQAMCVLHQSRLSNHQSIMSTPEIPVEVWSEIFAFSCDYEIRSLHTLALVSHSFRNIINATPQLWETSFEIGKRELADMGRVQFLMRKSGALPLQITINPPACLSAEEMKEVGEKLNEMVPRFEVVTLVVYDYWLMRTLMDAMTRDRSALLLEEYQIFAIAATPDENAIALRDIFHPSPRLVDVKLPPELIPCSMAPPSPFFFAITKISIQNRRVDPTFFLDRLLKLLTNMPVLEEFSYASKDHLSSFPPPDLDHPITPRLRSVKLRSPGLGMDTICLLRAPCLREVHINADCQYPDIHYVKRRSYAEYLKDRLHRLSCTATTVTTLTLHGCEFLDFEYTQLLQGELFSNLECLVLWVADIADEILGGCRPGGKLRRLELHECNNLTYDGALPFVERCSKDFELIIIACWGLRIEDVRMLARYVEVSWADKLDREDRSGMTSWGPSYPSRYAYVAP